jgi:hypothetical protein
MKLTGSHSITLLQGNPKFQAGTRPAPKEPGQDGTQFDAATPGGVRYAPTPAEEDFFSFMFRQLSATIVGSGSWKATDFRNLAVLKASVPLLSNKPAYTNHDMEVGNEVGHVGTAVWKDAYTNEQNVQIPAGIEAPFVLDFQLQPKLVRQMNSPVSPVQCCSVTIDFEWEASHEFENEWDFYYHLGEIINDEEVRRIVTKINDYYESSLVWKGADVFARMLIGDQVLDVNVQDTELAGQFNASKLTSYDVAKVTRYYVAEGLRTRSSAISNSATPPTPPPNSPNSMKHPLFSFMGTKLGLTAEQVEAFDQAKFDAAVQSLTIVPKTEYDTLKAEHGTQATTITSLNQEKTDALAAKTKAEGEVNTLTQEKEANASFVEAGKSFSTQLRAAAEAEYTKFAKGNPDQKILDELKTADTASLEAKIKMWGGATAVGFAAHCTKCNSSDSIDFRSSVAQKEGMLDGPTDEEHIPLSERFRS